MRDRHSVAGHRGGPAVGAHAAAREVEIKSASAAARAAGHAVATAHMADHSLGASLYALRAVEASVPGNSSGSPARCGSSSDRRWRIASPATEPDPPGARYGGILLARASDEEQAGHVGNQTGGRVFLFLCTDDFERDKGVAMKTQYYTASSLDGFIADRENSLDWLMQFDAVEGTSYPAFIREVGAIAMGSTTYEWLLRHEIRPDSDRPKPWPNKQPTWAFSSRSLPTVPGADIRFASGDIRPVHREMVAAAGGKNIWIVGGGELAGQFHDHGLLDELIIQVASVTLGGGAPLLPRSITTPPLRLLSVTPYGEAFAELRYAVPRPRGEAARSDG